MFNDVTINTSIHAWKNCFEGSASFMIVITENIALPECNNERKENMLNILNFLTSYNCAENTAKEKSLENIRFLNL